MERFGDSDLPDIKEICLVSISQFSAHVGLAVAEERAESRGHSKELLKVRLDTSTEHSFSYVVLIHDLSVWSDESSQVGAASELEKCKYVEFNLIRGYHQAELPLQKGLSE